MKTIPQRVQAGIKFLDKKYGKKWRKKIDLNTLDLKYSYSCILGQIDEDFWSHQAKLKLTDKRTEALGFGLELYGDYESLTSAWKKALKGKVGRNA